MFTAPVGRKPARFSRSIGEILMKLNFAVFNVGTASIGMLQTRSKHQGDPDMFHQFVVWLAHTVGQWEYPGIEMLMTPGSYFSPFSSEVVIPPASDLAAGAKMIIGMVILGGTLGSLLGRFSTIQDSRI